MKLEIFDEVSGETQVFQSTDLEVTIGSRDGNTLVLDTPGISGNHLKIIDDGAGNLQVTDLGSKNGTFINAEALEPNVPADFNTFFPVVLAKLVNISILEDDGSDNKSLFKKAGKEKVANNTARKVTGRQKRANSLGTGTATKTRVNINRAKRKKPKSNKPTVNPLIVIGCIALASYFAFQYFSAKDEVVAPVAQVAKPDPAKAAKKKKKVKEKPVEAKSKLSLKDINIWQKDKCLLPDESKYCQYLLSGRNMLEGFFVNNNVLILAIDGIKLFESIPVPQMTKEQAELIESIVKKQNGRFYMPGLAAKRNYQIGDKFTLSNVALLGIMKFLDNKNFMAELFNDDEINRLEILIMNPSGNAVANYVILEKENFLKVKNWDSAKVNNILYIAKRSIYMDDAIAFLKDYIKGPIEFEPLIKKK